jgi:FtsH-binding integral membrane protein
MKEIPMSYIKANQTGIVLLVLLSFILQQQWLLWLLLLIQAAALLFGIRANAIVLLAKPFLRRSRETQAVELAKFNQTLAVLFLTAACVGLALDVQALAYIAAGMLLVAASAAILGYCIGCTIYYRYKQLKARLR